MWGMGAARGRANQDPRAQGQGSWSGWWRKTPGPRGKLTLVYLSDNMAGLAEPGRGGGGSGGGVKQAIDHVAHLLHTVLDVLLRILGEGHAAIPDQALRSVGMPSPSPALRQPKALPMGCPWVMSGSGPTPKPWALDLPPKPTTLSRFP